MKKKIGYMGYCKTKKGEWISVHREHDRMRFYRNLTLSSKVRFQKIQDYSKSVIFAIVDSMVDLQISMQF